jgi:aryl-alcohol dehydrogenase-like predicted oxidoreductase
MVDTAPFGRTGHQSTRVIFGSAGLGEVSQQEADAVLDLLLAHGVNHLDTAASYGEAEVRMGPWMATHRAEFFLATKTDARQGDAARASLERSLERLQVDQVDLIQLHNLVEEDEWDQAFAPGGAVEALARARDEGLARFIGVTGHGLRIPSMHLRSLERFDFDSVLFPYNPALLSNPEYRADAEALIETCVERTVALQTIKAIARRRWQGDEQPGERRLSWYEPLTEAGALDHAVRFTLSRPELFLITSSDWRVLPQVLDAAQAFFTETARERPSEAELEADRRRLDIRPLFDGAQLERI